MSKLYRFELAFDGEPQGVGFLRGIDDTGLSKTKADRLLRLFDDLPLPTLDGQFSFWFTEYGLEGFKDAINHFVKEIKKQNWKLIGAIIDNNMEQTTYCDQFQVAFTTEYIKTALLVFVEVKDVDEFKRLVED